MVKKVSGGRFQGTLAAAIIVEAVDLGCNEFVRSAVEATKSFLADHPDNIQLAKLGGYKVLDVEESIIALELSIDTADVRSLVDYICADLDGTRNSDPVKDLQAFVIDADLSDLNAVNGIVEQVISTCPSVVGPLEADGLTSTFFTYLLSNEFPDDVTPPTFTSFAWNWGNEPNTIRLYWTLWEPADVSAFELQVLHGGDWSAIEVFRSGTPLSPVYTTDYYRFALRAFDAAGNVSPWHFLDPRVSC